ncbi:hypothetical protein ACP70R_024561 [Stipagrostis hirtigluma subsp. patula]
MSTGGSDDTCSSLSSAATDRRVALSELLGHIHGYYKAALDRLPAEDMPVTIPRLLDAGVCFGLLDPVSNIVANTFCACDPSPEARSGRKRKRDSDDAAAAEEEARRRDEAMSEITTDASCISYLPPMLREFRPEDRRTVAQRSLEGLVTFLVCYFRHLPVSEALQYLRLAKADLLAAVHLIECSRGMGGALSPISSPTMEIALRCAAMAASHPEPAIFTAKSLLLASRLEQLSQILGTERCLSLDAVNELHKLLDEPIEQPAESPKPVRHAALRLNRYIRGTNTLTKCSLEFTDTLRTLLLEKIHVLYLKAIARIPSDALRSRHHRGLVKAGLCFGPVDDPVSNIILNTVWYDTAFPPHEELEMDVIGTKSLMRIECHSLNGLLAFLRKFFPALSEHDATQYLFRSNASLQDAVFRAMENHDISSSYEDAYKAAAAEASCHPHPEAQAEFAMSTFPKLLPILESSQGVSRKLTSSEVNLISNYFSQKSYPGKPAQSSVPKLDPKTADIVSRSKRMFMADQYFISRKVKVALQRYARGKGTEYELHVICGANVNVPENGRHGYLRSSKLQKIPVRPCKLSGKTKGFTS